ncbi:hypothetical protein Fleli_0331 [Bernardetia litoralis DSM 6794]|uniref:Uncharacterized protein n=1 Tax=Bernardetia litoralis (strain ATCC 23117 / DSM 6794 / NBRC 15988 / NCIMB 1366 / Fx l1 / Sio-4) TaxID=880071 RepID=I4AFT1_BERLS|nr:hypothetical protein [Bernardetia litoralis]AFM02816.1 hypothetical protein Fleli_0331 [Bernardetia litoralis DSM 6794]
MRATAGFFGDEEATLEHAKAGPEHGHIADNIANRRIAFQFYLIDLKTFFYSLKDAKPIKNEDNWIFDFVRLGNFGKDGNVLAYQNFINMKTKGQLYNVDGILNRSETKGMAAILDHYGYKYTTKDIYEEKFIPSLGGGGGTFHTRYKGTKFTITHDPNKK